MIDKSGVVLAGLKHINCLKVEYFSIVLRKFFRNFETMSVKKYFHAEGRSILKVDLS